MADLTDDPTYPDDQRITSPMGCTPDPGDRAAGSSRPSSVIEVDSRVEGSIVIGLGARGSDSRHV